MSIEVVGTGAGWPKKWGGYILCGPKNWVVAKTEIGFRPPARPPARGRHAPFKQGGGGKKFFVSDRYKQTTETRANISNIYEQNKQAETYATNGYKTVEDISNLHGI